MSIDTAQACGFHACEHLVWWRRAKERWKFQPDWYQVMASKDPNWQVGDCVRQLRTFDGRWEKLGATGDIVVVKPPDTYKLCIFPGFSTFENALKEASFGILRPYCIQSDRKAGIFAGYSMRLVDTDDFRQAVVISNYSEKFNPPKESTSLWCW